MNLKKILSALVIGLGITSLAISAPCEYQLNKAGKIPFASKSCNRAGIALSTIGFSCTAGNSHVALSWTESQAAKSFVVQRRLAGSVRWFVVYDSLLRDDSMILPAINSFVDSFIEASTLENFPPNTQYE